jgi:hypothetical protein
MRARFAQDGAPRFSRQLRWSHNARRIAREIFYEQRGDVRGGVRDGRGNQAAPANLIQSGKTGVPAHEQRLVVFRAAHEYSRREAGVFESALADEFGHLTGRGRFREAFAHQALGAIQPPLAIPTVEALEIVATDFCVDVANRDDVGEHTDFVLGGEKRNFSRSAKRFASLK